MSFKYHKKIQAVLKEARLPKAESEALKKELESYFYEKERDLQLAGLKSDEIKSQIVKDFGNEELVAKQLSFVHKKSFYSFIKALMKNKNKPSIFETVLLLTIFYFLHQSILAELAIRTMIASFYREFNFYSKDIFFLSFLLIILSCILIIRLYRGGEISQKVSSVILSIMMIFLFGYNYFSPEQTSIPYQNKINNISDWEIIQNPDQFDEPSEVAPIQFYNEKDGYTLSLPFSYMAFRKDGTSNPVKYFTFPKPVYTPETGEIVAFGKAFSSDKERINIQVFDQDNSPDKKSDETWTQYYLRTYLKDKQFQVEPVKVNGFFGNNPVSELPEVTKVHLSEPLNMRQDLLIQEEFNRLYVFLYDAQNSLHQEILSFGASINVPNEKIKWVTFDQPECPFTFQIPDYWTYGYTAGYGEFIDMNQCNSILFSPQGGGDGLKVEIIQNESLEHYLESEGHKIKKVGETQWQGLTAKRFLVEASPDQNAGFAVEVEKDKWLIFSYNPFNEKAEKILNSLHIK